MCGFSRGVNSDDAIVPENLAVAIEQRLGEGGRTPLSYFQCIDLAKNARAG